MTDSSEKEFISAEEVEKRLHSLQYETRAFIGGEYVSCESGETIPKVSPYDGRAWKSLDACGEKEIDQAVKLAQKTFESGIWSRLSPLERKSRVLRLAELMEENKAELALLDCMETGRALRNYYEDSIPKAIDAIRYYAELTDKVYEHAIPPRTDTFSVITRVPLGVVGVITPWNDPLVVAAWKFTPSLLVGNCVIVKPAEQSSFSILKVAKLAKEAGIPDGVFQVVPGYGETAGKALAQHPLLRGILFTGSSEVGKLIMQYAGQSNMKKVGLECGGKSAFIVSDKCRDPETAAKVLAENMFYNQGQICSAPSRVILGPSVRERFLQVLSEQLQAYAPGNPFDPKRRVGCMVNRQQFERVKGYLLLAEKEGAQILQAKPESKYPEEMCAIVPTVLVGLSADARTATEEIFGPVVTILDAGDLREAVAVANASEYGLAGAVFTDDLNEAYYAAHRLEAGLVHINSYGEDDMSTPFGGVKQSGLGKDRSVYAFDECTDIKTVWMKFANQ